MRSKFSNPRKRAFTLAEILIAVAVGGIVLLAAVSFLFSFILNLEQTDEHTAATQRAEMVVTILGNPILQAGIGMPRETAEFQESLTGLTTIQDWSGPVDVATSVNANDTLRLAFGVGTGLGVEGFDNASAEDGEPAVLTLSDSPPSGIFAANSPSLPKGWCLLPASGVPLRITAASAGNLTVTVASGSSATAAFNQFDQVYILRGMQAGVTGGPNNPVFYTNDIGTGTGNQPRVQGISGVHFDFDPAAGVVSMVVLARGNKRHAGQITPTAPDGWDTSWGFSTEDTHYRFSVLQTSWRIRN